MTLITYSTIIMVKKIIKTDPLVELLEGADREMLITLIDELAKHRLDVRRECFDYLNKHISLSTAQRSDSDGEIIMALWNELYSELQDFDECGGGDYDREDNLIEQLADLIHKLENSTVEEKVRCALLEEVMPFIISSNAGFDDQLYELAYATCSSDEDWRNLAQMLEAINQDSPTRQAREIYRKLGDRAKYLELRDKKMKYGDDYHDLATFYLDEGNRKEAISVAEEGMKKGVGRMDGLRKFLSDRALEDGNREKYLALQFELASEYLSLETYNTFKNICSVEEWSAFEPKIVELLDTSCSKGYLKIRMQREEYEEALAILLKSSYHHYYAFDADDELNTVQQLEKRFPEQILTYYKSGLGNLNSNAQRKEYAQQAGVMAKVRHMMVDVIQDETRWTLFAGKVKADNLRRPAFQEEFGRVLAGWGDLQ